MVLGFYCCENNFYKELQNDNNMNGRVVKITLFDKFTTASFTNSFEVLVVKYSVQKLAFHSLALRRSIL